MQVPYFRPQVTHNSTVSPFVPRNAFLFAEAPAAAPPAAPSDSFQASEAAQLAGLRSGPQNLMLFGGDRKNAVETLIASGAKPENPKLPWHKNLLRKFAGSKTKTASKQISPEQTITSKVRVKNFNVRELRLTTQGEKNGNQETLRHVDFHRAAPNGKQAQVKDIGSVIAQGQVKRMSEQNITHPGQGEPGRIKTSYFDPKSGQKFMQTSEVSPRIEKDKFGAYRSKKEKTTYRQIDLLNQEGKANQRYVFDYAARSVRLEQLNDQGEVSSSRNLSRKTDYWKLVDQLSTRPPSSQVAAAATAGATPGAENHPQQAA